MAQVITRKVAVGISACAFGCPVRYNGRGTDALVIVGRERSDFEFTPVCPECLAGLGVPRVPIHLTGTGAEVLAGTAAARDRHGRDVTGNLIAGCRDALAALDRAGVVAFVAREASPSCGLNKARVGRRRSEQRGAGVFGAMLADRDYFLIPDDGLANALAWWDWRRRLHAWLWLRERTIARSADLYDAWHVVKFIVQETDRPFADDMGRRLAALPRGAPIADLEVLRREALSALKKPSTRARIRSAMWKTYSHARKKGQLDGVDLHDLSADSPEVRLNVDQLAAELTRMERISFDNDLLFGTSPVIARDRRRIVESTAASD